MEEQLISFDTAKLSKERGFDLKIRNWFDTSKNPYLEWESSITKDFNNGKINQVSRPSQSLLQKWLREIKQVEIVISPRNKDKGMFYGCSVLTDDLHASVGSEFKSYEEALEKGLMFALKLLK